MAILSNWISERKPSGTRLSQTRFNKTRPGRTAAKQRNSSLRGQCSVQKIRPADRDKIICLNHNQRMRRQRTLQNKLTTKCRIKATQIKVVCLAKLYKVQNMRNK